LPVIRGFIPDSHVLLHFLAYPYFSKNAITDSNGLFELLETISWKIDREENAHGAVCWFEDLKEIEA